MNAEDLVSLLLRDELHLALGVEVRLRPRVGHEGELADLVLDTVRLELLLGLADPGDFRMSVDDGGNCAVVDVTVTGVEILSGRNALLLGLVREHGTEGDVADTLDASDSGVELRVNDDTALGVDFDADLLEVEAGSDGTTADRDEDDVGFEDLFLSALGALDVDEDLAVALLRAGDLGVQLELEALLCQGLLELLAVDRTSTATNEDESEIKTGVRNLLINTHTTNTAQKLDNSHVSAETTPDATHLETDDTTTNNNHLPGNLGQLQCTSRADDLLLVDLDGAAREWCDLRPSSDDDVLCVDFRLPTIVELDRERGRRGEGSSALDIVDLVLLEEMLDTLRKTSDRVLLGLQHLREVEANTRDYRRFQHIGW